MFNNKNRKQLASIPTPFYYYNTNLLEDTLELVSTAAASYGYTIHYAFKANNNNRILKKIQQYGLGADCVNGNEISKALDIGFSPNSIVFAGVGKTDSEILFALKNDIFCFNCESVQEIKVINQLAAKMGKKANIAIRINPNVDANTHKYITTGLSENKFGILLSDLTKAIQITLKCANIKLIGLHFHIGSQITRLQPFIELCKKINIALEVIKNNNIEIEHINVGGGLGINYEQPDLYPSPDFYSYFNVFAQNLNLEKNYKIHFELGRSIVGNCGSLVTKVLYNKKGKTKNFLVVDAGMTDLLRPALYQSTHKIEHLTKIKLKNKYEVVGPICETADSFGSSVLLPHTVRGDILVIRSAGAYGQVMKNNYNMRGDALTVYDDQIAYANS